MLHCFFCLSVCSVPVNSFTVVLILSFPTPFFPLLSLLSQENLSPSCIVYLASVMILKSDILFSKKPIAVTFENLAQCLQVSFIMFLKTLSSNILSNLNLFLKVLVLLEKFRKRGRGD